MQRRKRRKARSHFVEVITIAIVSSHQCHSLYTDLEPTPLEQDGDIDDDGGSDKKRKQSAGESGEDDNRKRSKQNGSFNPAMFPFGVGQGMTAPALGFYPFPVFPNSPPPQHASATTTTGEAKETGGNTEDKGENNAGDSDQQQPKQMMGMPNPLVFPPGNMPPGVMPFFANPRFPFPPLGMPRSAGVSLSLRTDVEMLSDYQILIRQQLELFEAGPEDVETNTQGRKKPVVLEQVGLRCRHCAFLPVRSRGKGAVYFPMQLKGIYQAAQNMSGKLVFLDSHSSFQISISCSTRFVTLCLTYLPGSHLINACQHIPPRIREDIRKMRERRDNASGGKQYWADGCRALGLVETESGLKMKNKSVPTAEGD
jgi:hypothetical protein